MGGVEETNANFGAVEVTKVLCRCLPCGWVLWCLRGVYCSGHVSSEQGIYKWFSFMWILCCLKQLCFVVTYL